MFQCLRINSFLTRLLQRGHKNCRTNNFSHMIASDLVSDRLVALVFWGFLKISMVNIAWRLWAAPFPLVLRLRSTNKLSCSTKLFAIIFLFYHITSIFVYEYTRNHCTLYKENLLVHLQILLVLESLIFNCFPNCNFTFLLGPSSF